MKNLTLAACAFVCLTCCAQGLAVQPSAKFDVVALVDSLDFAKDYDIETATGTVQTLEHVLLTHANDIWWRDKGGGRMRYPSECEMWQALRRRSTRSAFPARTYTAGCVSNRRAATSSRSCARSARGVAWASASTRPSRRTTGIPRFPRTGRWRTPNTGAVRERATPGWAHAQSCIRR